MPTLNAEEVKAMLTKRYAPPEYAIFEEVASGTGAHLGGYADMMAYSLFPSMGHALVGFEIKVSRSDWLNELKKPQKSGQFMQYCDHWWLVAPKGIAFVEEIPKPWGFLEISNGKFFTKKRAPELESTPLDPSFIAALLRRSTENVVPRSVLYAREKQAAELAREGFAEEIKRSKDELERYRKKVEDWEAASGLQVFGSYRDSKELGSAVKWVLDGGLKRHLEYNSQSAIDDLRRILTELETFKKVQATLPDIKIK